MHHYEINLSYFHAKLFCNQFLISFSSIPPFLINTYYFFILNKKISYYIFKIQLHIFQKYTKLHLFLSVGYFFHSFSGSICESMKNTLQSTFFNFSSKSKLIYFFKSNLFKGDYCLYTFFQFIFYCNHLYFIVTIKGIYIGT